MPASRTKMLFRIIHGVGNSKVNVAVAHLSLNFLGGEERLCLSFIEALKLCNHRVTLFTIEQTDWASVREFFGDVAKPNKEVFSTALVKRMDLVRASTVGTAYANYLIGLTRLIRKRKYDLVINTYGDLVSSFADVAYVHFPIKATLDYSQIPAFVSPFKWTIYCQIYRLIASVIDRINPSLLLTNSKFTQQVVYKYLKRNAFVLHPPVDVHAYTSKSMDRENYVITISKFTPKRHLHRVPLIAKNTRNARFVIVGGADKYSTKTISDLQKTINNFGVEDRVTLMPNVSRSRFVELLANAKVYLHVMPDEHFGISVIEAMAAGCVPVVHRSGGPWLDILEQKQGKYGFSYATPEEAAGIIDNIMVDESMRSSISSAAKEHSSEYDESAFRRKLMNVLEKVGSIKR